MFGSHVWSRPGAPSRDKRLRWSSGFWILPIRHGRPRRQAGCMSFLGTATGSCEGWNGALRRRRSLVVVRCSHAADAGIGSMDAVRTGLCDGAGIGRLERRSTKVHHPDQRTPDSMLMAATVTRGSGRLGTKAPFDAGRPVPLFSARVGGDRSTSCQTSVRGVGGRSVSDRRARGVTDNTYHTPPELEAVSYFSTSSTFPL
jgi:hypothetical protein